MIEILSSGASNSVQDLGRSGYLNAGVGRSGAMDREALIIANRLIGNGDTCAGLEITLFPFRLKFRQDMRFSVAGAFGTMVLNEQEFPGWWAASAKEGDVLTLNLPQRGARAYLAFEGGIDTDPVLGSRATDLKSGFGGHEGRGLMRGDILRMAPPTITSAKHLGSGFGMDGSDLRLGFFGGDHADALTLRVIAAAEHEAFTQDARTAFYDQDWTVSSDANRQGYRLDGAKLTLSRPLELFSHGIMPGTVQVPPSGQPVVQLADANTCGGYPKIACVIEADLWKLAQSRVGQTLRFNSVSWQDAIEALKLQNRLIDEMGLFAQLAGHEKVSVKHD